MRVLCVDDEPLVLRSLKRELQLIDGIEVATAGSAAEARELLAKVPYAVLLTDHKMPDETGLDLLESVSKEHPHVVAILASGHADLNVTLEAINRGHVYGLLTKPWQQEELIVTVRHALDRYELRRSLEAKVSELRDANRTLERTNRELAESRSEMRRLYEIASTDHKTGVRSYRYFTDRLGREVARARRYDRHLSLMLIDLDGFKSINDRFGHYIGDTVLYAVAQLLQENLRVMDELARFGGDEFAIILPDTGVEGSAILGQRLRDVVRAAAFDPAGQGDITISMGIASMPEHAADDGPALLKLADDAMYRAKDLGRDRYVIAAH